MCSMLQIGSEVVVQHDVVFMPLTSVTTVMREYTMEGRTHNDHLYDFQSSPLG